nr:Siderophore iron transporter mirB 2 [Colletotrichum truncatum]KAF6783709.1 Siderophore iron transporter mirB 2 [Colletotrichum truncatum]
MTISPNFCLVRVHEKSDRYGVSRMEKEPQDINARHGDGKKTVSSVGVIQSDLLKRAPKKWIIAAFIGLYLLTFIDAFVKYSTSTYSAYATSAFKGHSLLSASRVVETIAMLLSYPIIAKLSDVCGRATLKPGN